MFLKFPVKTLTEPLAERYLLTAVITPRKNNSKMGTNKHQDRFPLKEPRARGKSYW